MHMHPRDNGNDGVVIARHLKHLRLQGKSDLTRYARSNILARVAAFLGVPLLDAGDDELYAWRDSLDGKVKNATASGYVSHVKMFYAWAAREHLIERDPAAALPVPPVPRRLPRPIGEADLEDALAFASPRVRTWFVLVGWCGLRPCEIALLRADCIRLRDEVPVIRVLRDATKGRNERVIPIHPFAAAELARAADMPGPFRCHTTGRAFRKADGSPVTPGLVAALCNRTLRELNIPHTLYSMRHRYLTQAYAVDHDIRLVQELAGHAHIQTTAGYAKADASKFAPTVNAIPAPVLREEAS